MATRLGIYVSREQVCTAIFDRMRRYDQAIGGGLHIDVARAADVRQGGTRYGSGAVASTTGITDPARESVGWLDVLVIPPGSVVCNNAPSQGSPYQIPDIGRAAVLMPIGAFRPGSEGERSGPIDAMRIQRMATNGVNVWCTAILGETERDFYKRMFGAPAPEARPVLAVDEAAGLPYVPYGITYANETVALQAVALFSTHDPQHALIERLHAVPPTEIFGPPPVR